MRQPITWILIPVITLTAVCGPWWSARLEADLNGDRAVDVLDAQAMVASALAAEGVLDVRDLQRLLGGAGEATIPQSQEDSESSAQATLPNNTRTPVLALAHLRASSAPPKECRLDGVSAPHPSDNVCPVAHARRLLSALTPHAPPLYT